MKIPVVILSIVITLCTILLISCQPDTGDEYQPVIEKEMTQSPGVAEAADDIMPSPGMGPQYRGNLHLAGEQNPWTEIKTEEAALTNGRNTATIVYRKEIETRAGERRNNIIKVNLSSSDISFSDSPDLKLYSTGVPTGIELTIGMHWTGPRMAASVLAIDTPVYMPAGVYKFKIGLSINGSFWGAVPCIVNIID